MNHVSLERAPHRSRRLSQTSVETWSDATILYGLPLLAVTSLPFPGSRVPLRPTRRALRDALTPGTLVAAVEEATQERQCTACTVLLISSSDERWKTQTVARVRGCVLSTELSESGIVVGDVRLLPDKASVPLATAWAHTPLDSFVWRLFDERLLARRLLDAPAVRLSLAANGGAEALQRCEALVATDAASLSYNIAAKLPLDRVQRRRVHNASCTPTRLRLLLDYAASLSTLRCSTCGHPLAEASDALCVSDDSSFVNRHGFTHSLVTLRSAPGALAVGEPSLEDTWFAGRHWTVACCERCGVHAGWLFTTEAGDGEDAAVALSDAPPTFWGLRVDAIAQKKAAAVEPESEGPRERTALFAAWPEQ